MEEQKKEKVQKKGLTYPAKIGNMDYVEYQSCWLMKKKFRKMEIVEIEKHRKKYQKYIEAYDAELKNRENSEAKKKQEEEDKEKELLEQLMKKYNKA